MSSDKPSLRILVIEDEAMVAMLLEDMLIELGHQVVATAGEMHRAVKLASELTVDLAIVDVNLHGEPAYPLATILTGRRVPFFFATGYGAAGLKQEWRGVTALQKPFQARELAAAISRARQDAIG
ncbi:MAG: response regulator [Xanthobacteraceae bacterium]|jgi:DNA-binding response OmpR family regulator